jgi:ketosteroid isomerase-like protein
MSDTQQSRNRVVVERLVQALNDRDARAFADCHTEDVVIRWMASGRQVTGREAAYQWLADAFEVFEGLSNEIVGIHPSGETVALEVIARGRRVKEFRGTPPGGELNQAELYIYHFRDGLIDQVKRY